MILSEVTKYYKVQANGRPLWGTIDIQADNLDAATLAGLTGQAATPYSASITPDLAAGALQKVVVASGAAFAINDPINKPAAGFSAEIVFMFQNTTGGACGAITWDAAFHLAGAYTGPAAGTFNLIAFRVDSTTGDLIEAWRSTGDIS